MPQAGGAGLGLFGGLVKGFGGTMLEIEDRNHQEARQDKQMRVRTLERASDSAQRTIEDPDSSDEDYNEAHELQSSITTQLGEILDGGKRGGKMSEKLKAMVEPIMAVGNLMRPGRGQQERPKMTAGPPPIPNAPRSTPAFDASADESATQAYSGMQDAASAIPTAPTRRTPADAREAGRAVKVTRTRQEALDTDKARILQQYALGDEEKARQLQNLSKETDAKITANIQVARKYYRVRDKDSPNGRPLRDDEALPDSYTQAIMEEANVMSPQRAGAKLQAIAEVDTAPEGAVDVEGNPVSVKGPFKVMVMPDGTRAYQPFARKALAGDVEFNRKVEAAVASGIPAANARTYVLQQGFKTEREKLAGLIERNAGTKLTSQMKQDFISGKVTPAIARGAMGEIRAQARTIILENRSGDTPPESPYYGKSQADIEDLLIQKHGYDKEELMDAIGGKTGTTAIPAAPTPKAGNPLGLPGL